MRSISTAVVLVTLLAACSATAGRTTPAPSRNDPRVLSGEQLRHPIARNAYDLIRLTRPQYFQFDGPARQTPRAVYIDGMRTERIEDLRLVPTDVIREIRVLSGPDAFFRYGTDNIGGAIVVTTYIRPRGSCPDCR